MHYVKLLLVPAFLGATLSAFAQEELEVERSSYPQGIVVEGDTQPYVNQSETAAFLPSRDAEMGTSGSAAVAGRSNVQIQGTTRIKAEQKNASAVAVGKGNAANNEVGVIGGK